MNLEPGQEVFEVMIAANKVGLVIGTYTCCMKHFKYFKQKGSFRFPPASPDSAVFLCIMCMIIFSFANV